MSRSVPSHYKPYPELVERRPHATPYWILDSNGKPWLLTNGMTSLLERKLYVPLKEGARSVSLHELGHVKWSPKRLPQLSFDVRYLMAVEDARLNLGLAFNSQQVVLTDEERAQVAKLARQDIEERDALGLILRAIASQGTNAEADVLGALRRERAEFRDLAYRHVRHVRIALLRDRRRRGAEVASFRLVKRLAAELARELGPELERLGFPRGLPFPLSLSGAGCCLGHGGSGGRGRRGLGIRAGEGDGPAGAADCPAGEMRIATPALPHPSPQPRGGSYGPSRGTSEGTLPRYLHRWYIDQAIFRRRTRVRGGTVLVDVSGSMSLDAAGIDRMLSASSGAALIAIYSGHEQLGELRIVARDGRRADAKDLIPFGRGNIIDEPALAWLAKQDGPRLWISDGGVTGVGDKTAAALQERCKELAQRGRIQRVKTIEEAAARLSRGGRHAGVA